MRALIWWIGAIALFFAPGLFWPQRSPWPELFAVAVFLWGLLGGGLFVAFLFGIGRRRLIARALRQRAGERR